MVVFIEVIEGQQVGQQFRLFEGAIIGSQKADVVISDPLIEAKHAKIQANSSGQLSLVDASSRSGVFIGGAKVRTVLLRPGVVFGMGESFFKVIRFGIEEETSMDPGPVTWSEALVGLLQNRDVQNNSKALKPFNPMVVLKVIHGPLFGEELPIGYGPRTIGRESFDLQFSDPNSPDQIFTIEPTQRGVLLTNLVGSKLLVNGRTGDSFVLSKGDKIEIGINVLLFDQI